MHGQLPPGGDMLLIDNNDNSDNNSNDEGDGEDDKDNDDDNSPRCGCIGGC
jgi:hypothetical protein